MSWLDDLIFGGARTIMSSGTELPARSALNFSTGLSAVDNAGADRTDVTVDLSSIVTELADHETRIATLETVGAPISDIIGRTTATTPDATPLTKTLAAISYVAPFNAIGGHIRVIATATRQPLGGHLATIEQVASFSRETNGTGNVEIVGDVSQLHPAVDDTETIAIVGSGTSIAVELTGPASSTAWDIRYEITLTPYHADPAS